MDRRIQRSRAQERRGAALHGGKRNVASGALPVRKGDVRIGAEYLVEYKRTDGKSITIKATDWSTNATTAVLEGRTPLMGLQIGADLNLIVMDERDWVSLRERAGDL